MVRLKLQSDRLGHKMTKVFVDKALADEKFDKKYEKLKKQKFKVDIKLSNLSNLREKNCHHNKEKYGRKHWANMRDDASFSTYVGCKNCGAVLWDECFGPRGGY